MIKAIQILNWESRLSCGIYDFFCFIGIFTFNAHLIYSSVTVCICPWHFVLPQLQQQTHMPDHGGVFGKVQQTA